MNQRAFSLKIIGAECQVGATLAQNYAPGNFGATLCAAVINVTATK